MKKFLVLNLIFLTQYTFAEGGMASGGGKGLVCFNSNEIAQEVRKNHRYIRDKDLLNITKIEMLDLHYAKIPRGFNRKSSTIVEGGNFITLLEKIISRIEVTIPILGKEIRKSESLFRDNIYFRNSAIEMANDENDIAINETDDCILTTLAKQYKDDGKYYIHLDERLFFHPKHSEVSKATLILHEYLYSYAISKGDIDSRGVREIVSIFIKNDEKVKIIDIAKKVFEANLTPFNAYSNTLEDDRRHNSTFSQSIDYTLLTMPMNFMFDWVASLYLTINNTIEEFDNNRPEGIISKNKIIVEVSTMLDEININSEIKSVSQAKVLLERNAEELSHHNATLLEKVMATINDYNSSRINELIYQIKNIIDDQKQMIIDFELKNQKSMTAAQVEAMFTIIKQVAYDRVNLINTNKASSISCGLNFCSGERQYEQDVFIEQLHDKIYLQLKDYTPFYFNKYRPNISWIKASIYKVYHERNLFDLNKIYMQTI